ncbi:MAG: rhodanese-like domain-containing protein [Myxococcales bacterium]
MGATAVAREYLSRRSRAPEEVSLASRLASGDELAYTMAMRRLIVLSWALALPHSLGACSNSVDMNPPKPSTSSASPLASAALVLDVRTPEEYAQGHLEGAMLIPVAELEARVDEVEQALGGNKDKKIVAYCRSGRRSGVAKGILESHGYANVINGGGYEQLK